MFHAIQSTPNSSNLVKKTSQPFVMIPNHLAQTNTLSSEAFRVVAYLESRPKNWKPRVNDLKKLLRCGDRVWRRVSKELRTYEFMDSKKTKFGTDLIFNLEFDRKLTAKDDRPTRTLCTDAHPFKTYGLTKDHIININKDHDHEVVTLVSEVVQEPDVPILEPVIEKPVTPPTIREIKRSKPPNCAKTNTPDSEQALKVTKRKERISFIEALDTQKRALYDILTKQLGINVDIAMNLIKKAGWDIIEQVYELSNNDSIINKGAWINVEVKKRITAMERNKSYNPYGTHNPESFKAPKAGEKDSNLSWEMSQPSDAKKAKDEATMRYLNTLHENKKMRREAGVNIMGSLCGEILKTLKS